MIGKVKRSNRSLLNKFFCKRENSTYEVKVLTVKQKLNNLTLSADSGSLQRAVEEVKKNRTEKFKSLDRRRARFAIRH